MTPRAEDLFIARPGCETPSTGTASSWPRPSPEYSLDHLGTPRLVTDQNATTLATPAYLPYGEEITPSATGEPLRFTGHERDLGGPGTTDDLDYMHARYCSPHLGRFLRVDPAQESADLRRPQSWNRYAYGVPNPVVYLDADGREVTYSTSELRQFYETAASGSEQVAETLAFYSGELDLRIEEGDPGIFDDGSARGGLFTVSVIDVGYEGNFSEIEASHAQGEDPFYPSTTQFLTSVEYSNNATIILPPTASSETKLHELGHADQRARQPVQYLKDSHEENTQGKTHDEQPAEIYADRYAERVRSEFQ